MINRKVEINKPNKNIEILGMKFIEEKNKCKIGNS